MGGADVEALEVAVLANAVLTVALAFMLTQLRDSQRYAGMLQDYQTDLLLRLIERVRQLEEKVGRGR